MKKILRVVLCVLLLLSTVAWVIPEDLPPKPYPEMPASLARATVGLPASFDWRDTGFVTPVKNQGSCGSCWAFASLAPLEFKLAQMGKSATDLSEQIVLNYSGAGDCAGGYMSKTATFLTSTGDTIEDCLPYSGSYQENSGACENWQEDSWRYSTWDYAYPVESEEVIKSAIYEHGPIACVFALYRDLDSYSSGIYVHDEVSSFRGYHAVACLGWNDSEEYLTCKNSWGTGWGEQGFFKIAYSQVQDPRVNFCYQAFFYSDVHFAYPAEPAFEVSEIEGIAPLLVEFTDLSTGTVDKRYWDFGDGYTAVAENVKHTFVSPDNYLVTLKVENLDGVVETSATVHVKPKPDPLVQEDNNKDDDGARGGCFFSTAKDNNN